MSKFFFLLWFGFVLGSDYTILSLEKCMSSGVSSTVNHCQLSDDHKTIIVVATADKNISQMNLTFSLEKQVNENFRQLFKLTDINWCVYITSTFRKVSPVVKIIIDAIKDSSSGSTSLLHPCPYFGEHGTNVTIKKGVVSMAPLGRYRIFLRAYNEEDQNIITFGLVIEIT